MLSKNVINEVIKEWSWRVPTGIPEIVNGGFVDLPSHVYLLGISSPSRKAELVRLKLTAASLSSSESLSVLLSVSLSEISQPLISSAIRMAIPTHIKVNLFFCSI